MSIALIVAIIASVLVPFGSFTASAATESDFEYVSFSGSAYIQKYVGTDEIVEIPSTLGGNTVVTLNDYAFRNCTNVKQVTIPSTITKISSSVFEGCVNLESVNIPYSVTYLGNKAFYGCTNLKSILIPSSVTYIGTEVLAFCSSLTSIDVDANSKGYVSVDGVLFDIGKTRLMQYPAGKQGETYEVPNKVWYVNTSAFAGCSQLTSITLPSSLSGIYDYAFKGCSALKSITIPSNVTSVGSYAFDACTALESIDVAKENTYFVSKDGVLFNKSETKIVRYPIAKSGETYTIPKTVTYIEYGSFADCTNLTSIVIHKTLSAIRNDSFKGCSNLTEITLPLSITATGTSTFEDCTSLTKINVATQNKYYSAKNGVLFNKDKTKLYFFPVGSEMTSYTVPDSVTTIDPRAFVNPTNLTSLHIPETVTYIRSDAFIDCDNLTIYAKSTSYAYDFAVKNGINVVATDVIKSVSHSVANNKITFTIVTSAGDFNRVKVTTPDNLGGSLAVASTYEINADGDYVWTVKTTAPKVTTEYSFDLRNSVTGKYTKEYFDYEAEIISNIKSITYEKSNGKVIFTVTTTAGNFNRVKATLADDLAGYVAYSDNYVVNADGEHVWTITANNPSETTEYAFDVRSSETGKYKREYVLCTVVPSIKSVTYYRSGVVLTLKVTTVAGDFDRLRCGISESTIGNLANSNYYRVDSNGDYVWTLKFTLPDKSVPFYLDLRNSNTGKFLKDFVVFTYTT